LKQRVSQLLTRRAQAHAKARSTHPSKTVSLYHAIVARRTLLGFAELLAALGVCLFAPAGTFNYWQAWLYLLVFAGSSAAITAYLWRRDPQLLLRRLNAGPTAERARTQQVIQAVAAVAFIGTLIVPALDRRFRWSRIPAPMAIAANIMVAAGFLIVFRVFRANPFTSATIELADEQQVVSTGPYARVRHPMYAGALLMLLATPIALGSWRGLVMFIPMLGAIVMRLQDEERYLSRHLSGYAEYQANVRHRLVPRVW
jgi:protein-S-isoprenylcysteine O-methyltransferase Ste14